MCFCFVVFLLVLYGVSFFIVRRFFIVLCWLLVCKGCSLFVRDMCCALRSLLEVGCILRVVLVFF